jgi:hypothetical protein
MRRKGSLVLPAFILTHFSVSYFVWSYCICAKSASVSFTCLPTLSHCISHTCGHYVHFWTPIFVLCLLQLSDFQNVYIYFFSADILHVSNSFLLKPFMSFKRDYVTFFDVIKGFSWRSSFSVLDNACFSAYNECLSSPYPWSYLFIFFLYVLLFPSYVRTYIHKWNEINEIKRG